VVAEALSTQSMPDYYRHFVDQAEEVREHLDNVGDREVATTPPATDIDSASKVGESFADAAQRHRGEA
jgi:hypothetical protein